MNTASSILVVDDDDDLRHMIVSSLESLERTIRQAENGFRALELCRERLPDVIILDYTMPGMTGIEVCQQVRKIPGGELVPIIMLTARDEISQKVEALNCGLDEYLTKPFNYLELLARVKAFLRIRELTMLLQHKNEELKALQDQLVKKERQNVVTQLAGSAAHSFGQPLSAILLNCHLLETLVKDDAKAAKVLLSIKGDAKRMTAMLEKLRGADEGHKKEYFGKTEILDLEE